MRLTTITILSIICFVLSAGIIQANPVINEADAPSFLFTMSAKSGTFEDGTLTLKDVPMVVYFSDRPARKAGMLSIQVFAQGWDQGPDSFKSDPPNGTLSVLGKDSDTNIVLVLSDPDVKVKEGTISFKVKILQGEIPAAFDHATLFIDSLPPPQWGW